MDMNNYMLASKLIFALESFVNEFGDLPVMISDRDGHTLSKAESIAVLDLSEIETGERCKAVMITNWHIDTDNEEGSTTIREE